MQYDQPNDEQLMQDFRRGDHRAFEEVFNHFYPMLVSFTYRLIGEWEEAEDIVSDTMRKLWDRHEHFDDLKNIRAFLFIAIRNTCLNYFKFRTVRDEKKEILAKLENEKGKENYIETRFIQSEVLKLIRDELENLPAREKSVFESFYFEELTVDEIATKLKLTSNAVRVLKFQAVEKLRNRFSHKEDLLALASVIYLLHLH